MKLIVSLLAFMLFLFPIVAQADETHQVKKGDTLYNIAKRHGVTVQELKKANHLTQSKIHPGKTLHIPSHTIVASKKVQKKGSNVVARMKRISPADSSASAVRPGKTPSDSSVSVAAPRKSHKNSTVTAVSSKKSHKNSLVSTKNPRKSRTASAATVVSSRKSRNDAPVTAASHQTREDDKPTVESVATTVKSSPHVVEYGESLYRISLRFGTTVKELKKVNHLKANRLQVGQVLQVPSREEEMPDVAPDTTEEPVESASLQLEEGQVSEHDPSEPIGLESPISEDDIGAYLSQASDRAREADASMASNPDSDNSLIARAKKLLGVPYKFGGESPSRGIDCSAFVQRVFRYFSIDLPRTAREQFKSGIKVSKNDLRVGDLLFFHTYARFPSHVGIYMGGGKMIHASSRYKKVTITEVDLPYYQKRFIGVIRIPSTEKLTLSQGLQSISQ